MLVGLDVLKQLLRAPRQLNAHQLQLVVAVGYYFLSLSARPLFVMMDFGEGISHGVGDV